MARSKLLKDYKRANDGLLWEHHKRMEKYNKINNDGYCDFNQNLLEILTFKECEMIFKLPKNTCVRDFKNGFMRSKNVRKSGATYLITRYEARRLYEKYWTQRSHINQSHLYCSFDDKKMTEKEFLLKFGGDEFKPIED